jgi:CRISPR-associated endonuclease Cas3-HD
MAMTFYSAPDEPYALHIDRVLAIWTALRPRFAPTLARLFGRPMDEVVVQMLEAHDLGKLTDRWQSGIQRRTRGERPRLPSHAAIGAAALLQTLGQADEAGPAAAFAVAIHHLDRGTLSELLERPDVRAIADGIVDEAGRLRWHAEAPTAAPAWVRLDDVTLGSLTELARTLRRWARGGPLLVLHRRRLQASALHHVLKVCDIRAAVQRQEGGEQHPFCQTLVRGGLVC